MTKEEFKAKKVIHKMSLIINLFMALAFLISGGAFVLDGKGSIGIFFAIASLTVLGGRILILAHGIEHDERYGPDKEPE